MTCIAGVQCVCGSKELAAATFKSSGAVLFPRSARAYLGPNAPILSAVVVTRAGGLL